MFDEDLQRLLPRIYETGSGDWDTLLDEIKQFLEGSAIALTSHDFRHNLGSILFARGYNHKFLRSYALYHAHQNVWLARERDYRRPGTIHVGEQLVPEHQLLRTKFYTEWLQPQDLHHRLCAVLSREQATAVFLELMRPRQWAGFDQEDIDRCRLLLPHLQRALQMHRRMADLEVERDAAFRALDELPWGVVFVDEHRNRLGANGCRPVDAEPEPPPPPHPAVITIASSATQPEAMRHARAHPPARTAPRPRSRPLRLSTCD